MTRQQANAALIAILETVAESPNGAPSGILYMALQTVNAQVYDLDSYQKILDLLVRGQLVETDSHLVTVTDKGKQMVADIAKARKEAVAE